jgi:hypothetical protein
MNMNKILLLSLVLALPAVAQERDVAFADQFGNAPKLSDLKGKVHILVYGDRKATDKCRAFGEELHLAFHPAAKGKTGLEARKVPAVPLPGVPESKQVGVGVIPVACCGSAPKLVQNLLKSQIKAASPDVPVWLDFDKSMQTTFGLQENAVNVAVFDAAGKHRVTRSGDPDTAAKRDLLQQIQNLRAEAAK